MAPDIFQENIHTKKFEIEYEDFEILCFFRERGKNIIIKTRWKF